MHTVVAAVLIPLAFKWAVAQNFKPPFNPPPKNKDVRDYTDLDFEALFDQWEENDDPLEWDEIDGWKKPPPLDPKLLKVKNGEDVSRIIKKGRRMSMYVKLDPDMSPKAVDQLVNIWLIRFFNNHINVQKRMVDDYEVDLLFHDGAQAWDVKHFLMEQDEVYSLKLENTVYPGKAQEKLKQKHEL